MSGSNMPSTGLIACTLGLIGAFLLLGIEFLARPWVVVGDSMDPALRQGDRVLVDVWTYRQRPPRPTEIVVFRASETSSAMVKRVAEVVATPDGRGASLWLLGDNSRHSLDSRTLGAVDSERVIGRVVVRLWPPPFHEFP